MSGNYVDIPPGGSGSGVSSLNSLTGALTLAAGSNITITPSGNTLTIASTGGGGGTPGGSSGDIQFNNAGSFGGETFVPLANGGFGLSLVQTNVATTGTIAALAPTTAFLNFTGSAVTTIQGMVSNATNQRIVIRNNGNPNGVVIKNQDAGATAANRFSLEASKDLTIVNGAETEFLFNTTTSRWNIKEIRNQIANDPARNLFSLISGTIINNGFNILLGDGAAGNNALAGGANVILGHQTAYFINSSGASGNIYIGEGAGGGATSTNSPSGSGNVVIGSGAGSGLTTGGVNVIIGQGAGRGNTSAADSVFLGQNSGNDNTTGNYGIAIGLGAGQFHQTGNFNISIGQSCGSTFASNLTNTVAIGQSARVTASNQMSLGGVGNPLYVGINNENPVYRLDVGGDVNVTGHFFVNGAVQQPWSLNGNALGSPGFFIGSTDFNDFVTITNNVETSRTTPFGLTGFQQVAPTAVVHAGLFIGTVQSPSSFLFLAAINLVTSGGYTFGSGNKDYSVYTTMVVSGTTIYSAAPANVIFTEPATNDYDPTSASAVSQNGTGYDPNVDTPPTYEIWAIWNSGAIESITQATANTGSWSDPVNPQEVNLSWTQPTAGVPSSYFIARNATDSQSISGATPSLLDQNSGWTAGTTPGLPVISNYTVGLTAAFPAGASTGRYLNTTSGTFFDNGTSITDDNSWSSGSTITPTSAPYTSLKVDGDAVVGNTLTVNAGPINSNFNYNVYFGSTSGRAYNEMPFQGGSYKKFILYLDALIDAGTTIGFPIAFINPPHIYGDTAATAGVTATINDVTLPATANITGFIFLEGF